MKITLVISEEQNVALKTVAGDTDPLEYLQKRVNEVLDDYVAQTGKTMTEEATAKLLKMSEQDRAEVLALIEAKPATALAEESVEVKSK
jgi:hypothetical protein